MHTACTPTATNPATARFEPGARDQESQPGARDQGAPNRNLHEDGGDCFLSSGSVH